ncbi:3-oxoacyl-[acyl-carrier-protein] synthase III C-terminal domain-containing protein [Azospirillum doebereinerae]
MAGGKAEGFGITGFGAHVPRLRLDRRALLDQHGWSHPGLKALARGQRSFADWDEDPVTMAVAAARNAVHGRPVGLAVGVVTLASTSLPFADRQNAGIVAAALGLGEGVATLDATGSLRAGTSALLAGLRGRTAGLVVAADSRRTKPASPQEAKYGDAAAAFTLGGAGGGAGGNDGVLAEFLGGASLSVDFVDHYRASDAAHDYGWEDRWVRDEGWLAIVPRAVRAALEEAGVAAADIAHFILPPGQPRIAATVAERLGIPAAAVRDGLDSRIGDSGAAHALLMLAHALEQAKAGDLILAVGFGQGADALVFRTTGHPWAGPSVEAALAAGRVEAGYGRFAALTGSVERDEGMRAELDVQTPLTVLYRKRDMLLGLVGGRCAACGTRQFPKARVCVNPDCNAWDTQEDVRLADDPARVVTWTADHLTYCPSPPAHYGLIQFEGGGRLLAAYADVDPGDLSVGAKLRMVFRVKDYDPRRNFRRYFWKAAPLRGGRL